MVYGQFQVAFLRSVHVSVSMRASAYFSVTREYSAKDFCLFIKKRPKQADALMPIKRLMLGFGLGVLRQKDRWNIKQNTENVPQKKDLALTLL